MLRAPESAAERICLLSLLTTALVFLDVLSLGPRPALAQFTASSFSVSQVDGGDYDRELGKGDLDDDGHPDFVMTVDILDCPLPLTGQAPECQIYGRIVIYWGGPSIQRQVLYPGGSRGRVAIGDVNGDGRNDLVVSVVNEIEVWPGTGTRTLGKPFRISSPGNISRLIVADIDEDGYGDLVVGLLDRSYVRILRGGPNSGYAESDVAFDGGYMEVIVGDFNSDRRFDILTDARSNGLVSLRFGSGGGNFEPAVTGPVTSNWLVAADLNGDGWLDLSDKGGQVFLGDGSGGFRPPAPAPSGPAALPSISAAGPQRVASNLPVSSTGFVTAGDFDGDGNLDLFAPFLRDTLAIFRGHGDGHFDPMVKIRTPAWSHRIEAGDFTGDGRLDIVVMRLDALGSSVLLKNQQRQGTPAIPLTYSVRRDGLLGVVEWRVDADAFMNSYVLRRGSGADFRTLTPEPLTGRRHYEWIDREAGPAPRDYWIDELTRTGPVNHYGPSRLPGIGEAAGQLSLSISANPIRESATITFELPGEASVRVDLLDSAGRLVCRVFGARMPAGRNAVAWDGRAADGRRLPVGAYFLHLTAGTDVGTLKILVAR